MTLKDLFKKFPVSFLTNFEKKGDLKLINNLSIFIYPSIILSAFIVYIVTFNSINNQKNENEKNLERFFNSEEFVNVQCNNILMLFG